MVKHGPIPHLPLREAELYIRLGQVVSHHRVTVDMLPQWLSLRIFMT